MLKVAFDDIFDDDEEWWDCRIVRNRIFQEHIQKHGTIAVGSHGCIKLLSDRSYFVSGLKYVVDKLEASTIVVYGAAPDKIFTPYKEKGIEVLQFDSDFMKSRKAVSA